MLKPEDNNIVPRTTEAWVELAKNRITSLQHHLKCPQKLSREGMLARSTAKSGISVQHAREKVSVLMCCSQRGTRCWRKLVVNGPHQRVTLGGRLPQSAGRTSRPAPKGCRILGRSEESVINCKRLSEISALSPNYIAPSRNASTTW